MDRYEKANYWMETGHEPLSEFKVYPKDRDRSKLGEDDIMYKASDVVKAMNKILPDIPDKEFMMVKKQDSNIKGMKHITKLEFTYLMPDYISGSEIDRFWKKAKLRPAPGNKQRASIISPQGARVGKE